MPLSLIHCLPHNSFLGFFAAFSSNVFPCLIEIVILFYSYHPSTYIDHQAIVPSFWFRTWRPCFLIAGMLYDIGMLGYCIYEEDITAVLVAVRIASSLYQLMDQLWLIKHWIPFFVHKQKRKFVFFRLYIMNCVWFLVLGVPSWVGSWQERNDIFTSLFFLFLFVPYCLCGLWYWIQGGVDGFFKYRFHCFRNIMSSYPFIGLILSIVGFSIGDGGGNNLQDTLYYHSAFVMIYGGVIFQIVVIHHRYIVVYEELAWKHSNPVAEEPERSPSSVLKESTTGAASKEHFPSSTKKESSNHFLSANNKVHCDMDVPFPSVELKTKESNPKETVAVVPSENHIEGDVMGTKSSILDGEKTVVKEDGGDVEAAACGLVPQSATVTSGDVPTVTASPSVRTLAPIQRQNSMMVLSQVHRPFVLPSLKPSAVDGDGIVVEAVKEEEDGKEAEDVEAAARGLVPQSATVTSGDVPPSMAASPSVNTPVPFQRRSSMMVMSEAHRRFALAFDGITRRASIIRSNVVTHEIMMIKLKRHELVCREMDKLYSIWYQLCVWEVGIWLAQIFLTLYLQSVNTPTIPGQDGYYCKGPLENVVNSAQFFNDFVFARR